MSDNFENKNEQNLNQTEAQNNAQNQKVKLRLRLKSGEEFEAEGSISFVLSQKDEFLTQNTTYLNKVHGNQQQPQTSTKSEQNIILTPENNGKENIINKDTSINLSQQINSSRITADDFRLSIPAIRRRQIEAEKHIPADTAATIANNQNWQIDEKIWLKVAYLDGTDIVLRRKIKDLKPGIAALITLAAAKMLAGITKMTALELSKSLRMSGYLKGGDRLDRILTTEIKAGTLFFEGNKRNREYMISHTGTAKAYTSAEHFLL